jgi:hypothetical protein
MPHIKKLEAGSAHHPGERVQAVIADDGIGTGQEADRGGTGRQRGGHAIEQQAPVVGLVHGEERDIEVLPRMGAPVQMDCEQVAAELMAVHHHQRTPDAAAAQWPHEHRRQHVDAEQCQAQPMARVGLVDFHALATCWRGATQMGRRGRAGPY